jgi:oligoendopeptidase F
MKIKTRWDFRIFKKENFLKERNLVLKRIENFYNKWSKENLRKPQNLLKFLRGYEMLLSTPPGIFAKEYLYYFLKSLLDTKNKKYKEKLEEVRRLQEDAHKKIFYLLEFLKNDKEKNKILNSPFLKNYKNFLEIFLSEFKPPETFKNKNFVILRERIDKEIKKTKWKLFNDKNLQDKILKKYSKLMEKALNEIFKEYLEMEKKFNLPFTYYEPLLIKGFDPQIMKIIKRGILENKENFRKEMKEYEAQKEKIDSLFSQKISLNKAIHLAIEIFNKIDKSFGRFVLNSFQKGLVDVYPKKNKYLLPRVASVIRSKFLQTFILLNYNNTLQDFLSLIHEFAHSLHNEFLKKYNSPLNSAQSEIIRETVTAIFVLFSLEMLKEKYNKELIEKKIKSEGAQRILYDMAIFSTQEEIYKIFKKRGKVKIREINKVYKKNIALFLGKNKAKEFSDYRWILNFYRALAFWHLPYFMGSLLSRIFIKEYHRDKKEFKKKLFKLMQAGLDKSWEEILKEIKIINHL